MGAVARQWDWPGQTIEEWFDERLKENPNYQLPNGWRVGKNGQVERIPPNFLGNEWIAAHPWIIPGAAMAVGGGLAAVGAGAAGAGGGGALASSALPGSAGTGMGTLAPGLGAGGLGASGAGAAGAAGGGGLTGFLSSPGGGALASAGLNLAGGVLQGIGQGKQNEQNLQFQREQLAEQKRQFDAAQLQARQLAGLGITDPTKIQNWRQQQAVRAAIMPGLRNFSVGTPQGMESFRPQVSGGVRIPEGGFGPETLAFFSPEARAAAENTFWQAASPFVAAPDLSQVGYGAAGGAPPASTPTPQDLARQALLGGTRRRPAGANLSQLLGGRGVTR